MGFYCGIDLHARVSQVAVMNPQGEVVLNRQVPNVLADVLALLAPYGPGIHIAVESTFNWYWLVDGLQAAGHDVHLGHPLKLALITKAKVKTDRKDAVCLADRLRKDDFPEAYIYPKATRPLRDLVRQRGRLVVARAREYAGVRLRLYREGILDHSRNSAKTVTTEELDALLHHPHVRPLVHQEQARIQLLSAQILQLEGAMLAALAGEADYQRLRTLPGVGQALGAVILLETGAVTRFASARHYASYCRLIPGCAESAGKVRGGRGRKQGNAYLKAAYTQAATHAVRTDAKVRSWYDRLKARHPGRGSVPIATNVIGHKLALAAYSILKEGTEYHEHLLFGN
ncbi:MAG TPA: IS110 family transposase [Thermoanaerobaculaceae bacterium]|nr:IS110 family transposase [Thermoanaerobaculaceae bacterium]